MQQNNKTTDNQFLVLFVTLALLPLIAVYSAYILQTMWGWFIVPLGADQIGMAHAYGLTLVVAAFYQIKKTDKKETYNVGDVFGAAFKSMFYKSMMLGLGYLAHSLM